MTPDPRFLRDYLEAVGRQRGSVDEEFARHVLMRLERGAREYGDNYRSRSLQSMVYETREEEADVAGWLALALDLIFEAEREGAIDAEIAHLGRLKVLNWAAAAQWLWRDMSDFLEVLGPAHND